MELTDTVLWQTEWVEQADRPRRLKFRRDGTGYYERDGGEGERFIHENLLFRVTEGVLYLKLAHARVWREVGAQVESGNVPRGVRIGARRLTLERDPYAWIMEERQTEELVLASDVGAALPSE